YVNPNVDRDLQGMFVDSSKADIPVVNNFSFTKSYIIRIQVPPGYETTYIPQDSGMDRDKFAFDINYMKMPGEVVLRKNFRIDFSLLKIEDFQAWNEMIEKLGNSYRETIVFEKIKNLN
ncbi:MAG: hypothetical protein V2I37_10205, partial [Marinilabiliaceae bacterium]|nr:hypothetical protein [Marinilabiliaceae bacterium]